MNTIEVLASYVREVTDKQSDINRQLKDVTMRDHQVFAAINFVYSTITNGMMFIHGTGTGKTKTACYVIKLLREIYPDWTVYILVKAALNNHPWMSSLLEYDLKHQYLFVINYDDVNFPQKFEVLQSSKKPGSRVLIIIDEAHDFISRASPNDMTIERRITKSYELIQRIVSKTVNKILLLTATPLINSHEELITGMGLLAPTKLPSISEFSKLFIYKDNVINTEILGQCLAGLVSVHTTAPISSVFSPGSHINPNFAKKAVYCITCEMSDKQAALYKAAMELVKRNSKRDMFHNTGRASCKFIYISPRKRLRAFDSVDEYKHYVSTFISTFKQEYDSVSISPSMAELLRMEPGTAHITSDSVYSALYNFPDNRLLGLFECSSKYFALCRLLLTSRGKCLVFEQLVQAEGIDCLKIYLKCFNITYLEYSGSISRKGRETLKQLFDAPSNLHGTEYKCVIISSAGSEGIEFSNITDILFTDMSWTEANLQQCVGRGIRDSSHVGLPASERYVNIIFLTAYINKMATADDEMLHIVKHKESVLNSIFRVLNSVSIESLYNIKSRYPAIDAKNVFSLSFTDRYTDYIKKNIKSVPRQPDGKPAKLYKIFFTYNIEDGLSGVDVCLHDKSTDYIYLQISGIYVKIGQLKRPLLPKIFKADNGSKMLVYHAVRLVEIERNVDNVIEDIKSIETNPSVHT